MRGFCGRAQTKTVFALLSTLVLGGAVVSAEAARLTLSWQDNAANEDGFKVERRPGTGGTFSQIATVAANVVSYVDTGLRDRSIYCYRVRAYNTAGDSDYANEACATTKSKRQRSFDPSKWESDALWQIKQVDGQMMLLGIAREGDSTADAAGVPVASMVPFAETQDLSAVEATVTVLDGGATGTHLPGPPRAAIEGFVYWDGTGSGGAQDRTGHVAASVGVWIEPTRGRPAAKFLATKCLDSECLGQLELAAGTLGEVDFFQARRLRLAFDQGAGTLSVQLGHDHPVAIGLPNETRLPPRVRQMYLGVLAVLPPDPEASATLLALFEDVEVNGAPYAAPSTTLPRVRILPGAGTLVPDQRFDLVIAIEPGGEAVTGVRVTVDEMDVSDALPSAIRGTLPSGGIALRFPSVSARLLPAGVPVLLGVEATTSSGAVARAFARWHVVE